MLKIDTEDLILSIIKRGMKQAHMNYDFRILKASKIPSSLKKSVKENASNFFDGGSEIDYVVLKVPSIRKEPSDATSKIVQLIKTNFLDGDPNNTFTTSDVQVGYIEKKPAKKDEEESEDDSEKTDDNVDNKLMYYLLKYKIEG